MAKVKSTFKDKPKRSENLKAIKAKAAKGETKAPKAKKEKKPKKGALVVSGKAAIVESPEQRHAKAVDYDQKIRSIEKDLRSNFVEMGSTLIEMESQELWKELTKKDGKKFANFDQWLKDAAPFSRASGYAAKESMKRLVGFIDKEELKQMPRFAVETIAKLPKEKRSNPKIRASAKKDSRKEFEKTVAREAPEAHIEQTANFRIDKSSRKIAERAIEVEQWVEGLTGVPETLESIFSKYLQSECELEAYQGMSNEEAYLKAHPEEQTPQSEQVDQNE